MRPFDKFVRALMFVCLAAGLVILALYLNDLRTSGIGKATAKDMIYPSLVNGLAWLAPALSLRFWDGNKTGRQSPGFYLFAMLSLIHIGFIGLVVAALYSINR